MSGINNLLVDSKSRIRTPRAGRVGAAHSGAVGRGEAGQDEAPTDRFAQETTDHRTFQGILHTCSERLFRSTNKRNPINIDGGIKIKVVLDQWFIRGTMVNLRSWLLTIGPAPF